MKKLFSFSAFWCRSTEISRDFSSVKEEKSVEKILSKLFKHDFVMSSKIYENGLLL